MRIAIEASWAQGEPTGVGQYVRELARALARTGGEHRFFLLHYTDEWRGPDFGESFVPVPYSRGTAATSIAFRLPGVLRELGADVYHVTNATGVPARASLPVVTTVHDLYRYESHARTRWWRDMVFKTLFRWSRRNTTRFIVNSRFTGGELSRQLGVPADRVSTVHLAPVRYAHPSTPETPMLDGKPYLLSLGALEHRKGPDFLLRVYDALAGVAEELPDLVFVGPDRGIGDAVERYRAQGRAGWQVHWQRYVDEPTKERWLQGARLFVMPSRFEGFGMPLLEAMDHGIPSLASAIPPFRELAADGTRLVEGWDVVGWRDEILRLLGSPAERQRLGRAGQRVAGRYSWDACACATLACYERAVREWRGG